MKSPEKTQDKVSPDKSDASHFFQRHIERDMDAMEPVVPDRKIGVSDVAIAFSLLFIIGSLVLWWAWNVLAGKTSGLREVKSFWDAVKLHLALFIIGGHFTLTCRAVCNAPGVPPPNP
jgi:hypothetical protein